MAFLAPAAAGAVSATAGATALAKGAAIASSASGALGTGLAAGTAMGGGAMAAMPALSYAGANLAAPGILGALPSAITPAAGIFAKAAPALAGLPSAVAPTAGIFSKAMPALAGLPSAATPALSKSLMMANAPLTAGANPASWSAVNQAAGLGDLGFKSAQLPSNFIKVADTATKGADLATKTGADFFSKAAGQVPGTSEANALIQQAKAGEAYTNMAANQARVAADAARSQKLAIEAGLESPIIKGENFLSNLGNLIQNPSVDATIDYAKEHPVPTAAAAYGLASAFKSKSNAPEQDKGMIRPYQYARTQRPEAYATSPVSDTSERLYFNEAFTPLEPYKAKEGGIMALAVGGPVETMAAINAVGANTGYPMAGINTPMYSNPMMQRPEAVNVLSPSGDAGVGAYSGEPKFAEGGSAKIEGMYKYDFDPKTNTFTQVGTPRYFEASDKNLPPLHTGSKTVGGIAPPVGGPGIAALMPQAQPAYAGPVIPAYQTPEQQLGLTDFYAMMNRRLAAQGGYGGFAGYAAGGGISDLGGYSDGGRLLKGPGDGVSDSIPAVIGERQPARLADGEFVVPARIVSELGNGSTEAGARKLYAMMDRVQKARRKTVGKDRVAANTKAEKYLPA